MIVLIVCLYLLVALSGIWLILQWVGHNLLYPSTRDFVEEVSGVHVREEVTFFAKDGVQLHGWWFPHPDATGAMLICHGNGGNISHRMWMVEDLQDIPMNLFLFDYRGYGKSKGISSEKGTAKDVEAAWEVVFEKLGRPEDPSIILYGRSLGGGVALQLPATCPVKGLVLESTFSSVLEIGLQKHPWLLPKLTLRNRYQSDLRIPHVNVPLLASHSPEDEVIPYEMGKRLYDLSPNLWGFCELSGAHDEAGWQTSPEYRQKLREFIRELEI